MGAGIILKSLAPLSLYLSGLVIAVMAMGGNLRFAILMTVFLLPLRNVIERIQNYPLGNQFIDILLFGSIIGWMVSAGKPGRKFLDKSFLNLPAVLLILYTILSLFLGNMYLFGSPAVNFYEARVQDAKNFCLLPVIFFLVFNNVREEKAVRQVFAAMCLAMAAVAYYTFNQITWHSSLISRLQIKGTFQFLGPNEVAAFFNVYTIIVMSVFYFVKEKKLKLLCLLLIIANLYCITFLYSRGAYAGLFIGMFILFLFKDKKMLIPLVLILLLWQAVLPQKVIERIKETKTETGELDESSKRRIDIWSQALDLYKSNPITGIGYGVFRKLGLDLGDTHNIYVKILTEQGTVGFILFLLTIISFMREGFKLYQKGEDGFAKGLGLGFFISIFVLLVNNCFGDRWSYLEPNAYLWIFAGLVASLNRNVSSGHAGPQTINDVSRVSGGRRGKVYNSGPEKRRKRIKYYDV